MKQILLITTTLLSAICYLVFKVLVVVVSHINLLVPLVITLFIIIGCGSLHYYDEINKKH